MERTLVFDEASLMDSVRTGNTDDFAEIIEQYQAPIQRYLYRLTGDYELARDLAQDTFVQAYKGILKTKAEISFRAWLYRIATNNARQFYRRKRILSFIPFSSINKTEVPDEDPTGNIDRKIAVRNALDKIPQDRRTCMVLHFVEGFKYREIAETMGISEEAVRKKVSRGSQAFRRIIESGDIR